MTRPRAGALYTSELLGLAVEVALYPFDPASALIGEARSRSCGSMLNVSLAIEPGGTVARVGLRISACAVGQAAAAIFAASAPGATFSDIVEGREALARWLGGNGAMPDWPRIASLAPALDHPGRHEAIQLPWRAALDALSKAESAG